MKAIRHKMFPNTKICHATKVRVGQILRYLRCSSKHTRNGAVYKLVDMAA
ncbi:MAG: hypothetical protein KBT39_08550 [Bacteroidales bacterium]|nr:hypothetical protein [Bacteroidales bacterium]